MILYFSIILTHSQQPAINQLRIFLKKWVDVVHLVSENVLFPNPYSNHPKQKRFEKKNFTFFKIKISPNYYEKTSKL